MTKWTLIVKLENDIFCYQYTNIKEAYKKAYSLARCHSGIVIEFYKSKKFEETGYSINKEFSIVNTTSKIIMYDNRKVK